MLLRPSKHGVSAEADISTAPLSMDGRLATSFANLLNLMWENACSALSPVDIKKLVAERRPEFGGSQQHDAQEMLMLLLDGLHEDHSCNIFRFVVSVFSAFHLCECTLLSVEDFASTPALGSAMTDLAPVVAVGLLLWLVVGLLQRHQS